MAYASAASAPSDRARRTASGTRSSPSTSAASDDDLASHVRSAGGHGNIVLLAFPARAAVEGDLLRHPVDALQDREGVSGQGHPADALPDLALLDSESGLGDGLERPADGILHPADPFPRQDAGLRVLQDLVLLVATRAEVRVRHAHPDPAAGLAALSTPPGSRARPRPTSGRQTAFTSSHPGVPPRKPCAASGRSPPPATACRAIGMRTSRHCRQAPQVFASSKVQSESEYEAFVFATSSRFWARHTSMAAATLSSPDTSRGSIRTFGSNVIVVDGILRSFDVGTPAAAPARAIATAFRAAWTASPLRADVPDA